MIPVRSLEGTASGTERRVFPQTRLVPGVEMRIGGFSTLTRCHGPRGRGEMHLKKTFKEADKATITP